MEEWRTGWYAGERGGACKCSRSCGGPGHWNTQRLTASDSTHRELASVRGLLVGWNGAELMTPPQHRRFIERLTSVSRLSTPLRSMDTGTPKRWWAMPSRTAAAVQSLQPRPVSSGTSKATFVATHLKPT